MRAMLTVVACGACLLAGAFMMLGAIRGLPIVAINAASMCVSAWSLFLSQEVHAKLDGMERR